MDSHAQGHNAVAALEDAAIRTAHEWHLATERGETSREKATSHQLASLLRDEAGLSLAVKFVDEVARPEDPRAAAKVLSTLDASDSKAFLGPIDRALFAVGAKAARIAPHAVVPGARLRLRQIVGHLVVDARDPHLGRHIARAKENGFRLNINLLGEAVLGEKEAASRTERTRQLLERDDVDYVSIKVSSLVSQISHWDHESAVERVIERLRPLYRAAAAKSPHSFVNLDMEEYKDLDLTLEVFERILGEEEFLHLEAGIVLQAYLPDACDALERLIAFGRARRERGGARIKIRVVKGANLAMEKVDAEIHGWQQAPYSTKEDVDANFVRFMERALRPDATEVLRLGVASHNLFDTALAYHLAKERGVLDSLDVEMLQGMAPAQARAVREAVGSVLLYTPVVAPADFDVAVSYLIRRLEENAQPQNFLHAMFDVSDSRDAMAEQEQRFRDSVKAMESVPTGPRRTAQRTDFGARFTNTPDSDPALPAVREWASALPNSPAPSPSSPVLSLAEVGPTVDRARAAAESWAQRPARERAELLLKAARELEKRRGELIVAMMHEGGKTIAEADPEVSEAVDFARYYAERALELEPESGPRMDGVRFTPDSLVLVTPPWNFPVAIPIGGVLAALAAGSAAILKPAGPVPCCSEIAASALVAAGIDPDLCQVVRTDEGEVGRALVSHDDVDTVILTGASETAHMFASWRAGRARGPRVFGETSGKNALVVTPSADLDLAAADLVASAFGHAGQKCSAASLGILVGSVADSERFRHQLVDAVTSIQVGWPQDLSTRMGPVIEKPEGKLLRALTTLEPGEEWLVKPQQLDNSGRLWSPGVKLGVKPGTFFHTTEVFGPVLGLMKARTLDEAIAWQNSTGFGLTGGLHSLDRDEIAHWSEKVEVGNAYINRHITGAIVQRQSFGGWKDSVVGPGAKAGGPNYVALFGRWEASSAHPGEEGASSTSLAPATPSEAISEVPAPRITRLAERYSPLVRSESEAAWLERALRSDAHAWAREYGIEHDKSALGVESNVFRYRPQPLVVIRCEKGATGAELVRLIAAAELAHCRVEVSVAPEAVAPYRGLRDGDGPARQAYHELSEITHVESAEEFAARGEGKAWRVRVVGESREGWPTDATVLRGPVFANGYRELLTFLREQAISRTLHRYGHVAPELIR